MTKWKDIPIEEKVGYRNLIRENHLMDSIHIPDNEENKEIELTTDQVNKLVELLTFIKNRLSTDVEVLVTNDLSINKFLFNTELDLSHCHFTGTVIFRECTFKENVNIRHSIFDKTLSFKKSKFDSKVRFHYSIFKKSVNFENTTFNDLVDFYEATFNEPQQFFLTDFLSITIFSNVTFEKQVQFLYNKVNSDSFVSFESTVFEQALDISRANFWCNLTFWGAKINGNQDELWLYQTDDISAVEKNHDHIALMRVRESFRIIKQVFRKENNNLEAAKFHKEEMILYHKEFKLSENKKKWEELITLWFNRMSNYFGTSWSRGIAFTFVTAFVFYILFILMLSQNLEPDWSWHGFAVMVKHYFQFLNVTSWDYKPFGIMDYNWAYVVLFIGRIFIGYGYYQVIQAFRKYGKN